MGGEKGPTPPQSSSPLSHPLSSQKGPDAQISTTVKMAMHSHLTVIGGIFECFYIECDTNMAIVRHGLLHIHTNSALVIYHDIVFTLL